MAASPAFAIRKLGSDVLVKINLPLEWQDNQVPGGLNAAYEMERPNTMKGYDGLLRKAFLLRLAAVFHEKGYTGRMILIDRASEEARGQPILVLDLSRWAMNSAGRFDCYFTARLVTRHGEADLGSVEYSDVNVIRSVQKNRDIGVERATDLALARFHSQLAEAGQLKLLPSDN